MSGSLLTLLRTLSSRQIEYIVVGGMAGVLHGAPVVTADLDIVHRRSEENVARLLDLLRGIGAVFRADPRRLQPNQSHLTGTGHLLLTTSHGPLDLLCEVGGEGFEELLPQSDTIVLGEAQQARVVTLPKLIALKEAAGRPKDVQALAVLRATLEELQRG